MSDASARLFVALPGVWTVERRIAPGGRFIGTARFTPEGTNALLYVEEGAMELDTGARLDAFRRYRYTLEDGAVTIWYADGPSSGTVFLRLEFAGADDAAWPVEAGARHLCGPDTYDGTFRADGPDAFEVTYRVQGPRKDYVMRSAYRRHAHASA